MLRAFALFALLASPAAAQNVLDSHFGNPALPSKGCFVRSYDKAHLAKHPDQLVTDISLSISPLSSGGQRPTLILTVKMRGDDYYYSGAAACRTKGKGLICQMEGDAGSYTLTAEKKGVLRLTVGAKGMLFEGGKYPELSGAQGDDRVFLIPNVDGALCN